MTDQPYVVRICRNDLTVHGPGEELTMSDGTVWLHPYSGRAPVRLRGVITSPDSVNQTEQEN